MGIQISKVKVLAYLVVSPRRTVLSLPLFMPVEVAVVVALGTLWVVGAGDKHVIPVAIRPGTPHFALEVKALVDNVAWRKNSTCRARGRLGYRDGWRAGARGAPHGVQFTLGPCLRLEQVTKFACHSPVRAWEAPEHGYRHDHLIYVRQEQPRVVERRISHGALHEGRSHQGGRAGDKILKENIRTRSLLQPGCDEAKVL